MSIREFFFGPKKIKAVDERVVFKALGVVFDVMHDDWVELEFRNPDGTSSMHRICLPGHNLRIGEFVTLEYRRGKK